MAALKTTMTITNVSGGVLAADDAYAAALVPPAVGGARLNPFPFPGGDIHNLANGATAVVKCNLSDLMNKQHITDGNAPIVLWDQMIQAGLITVAYAADATDVGVEVKINT